MGAPGMFCFLKMVCITTVATTKLLHCRDILSELFSLIFLHLYIFVVVLSQFFQFYSQIHDVNIIFANFMI